ncbi:MAG: hypothetical protein ACXADL_05980 [Candidatus Thorarchaeota archaeon]
MRTDPSIVKRERLLKKIANILKSKTLEKWQRDANHKFWKSFHIIR